MIKTRSKLRPAWLLLPLSVFYLGSLGQLVKLQAFPDEVRLHAGSSPRLSTMNVPVMRGRIVDRNGLVLADSVWRWLLVVDLRADQRRYIARSHEFSMADIDLEMSPIANLAGVELAEIKQKLLDSSRNYSVIVGGLSSAMASRIRPLITAVRGCGLRLERVEQRVYPQSRTLSHVLGFARDLTATGNKGECGLERMLNQHLAGADGRRITQSVGGSFGVNPAIAQREARRSRDFKVTLDVRIGEVLREELLELQISHQPDWSCGVVLDVRTSEVLAISAMPDYDPNYPGDVPQDESGNLIGHGFPGMWPFEPGSTMKPLVVSKALAEDAISPSQKFSQEGGRWYARGSLQPPIRNANGVPNHDLDWHEVLVFSSNIGAGKIGMELGADRLAAALEDWGLRDPSGLPWNDQNVLFPPEIEWNKRPHWTIPAVSIGHQVQTTALRLAVAYAAIANGGRLNQPRLYQNQRVSPSRQVLPAGIASAVSGALQDMVDAEHRSWLHLPDLAWGGKSGTVEKTHGDQKGKYTTLFVGFAPADDPQLVCVVVADNPKGNDYYGSRVCGPAVRDVLNRCLTESLVSGLRADNLNGE